MIHCGGHVVFSKSDVAQHHITAINPCQPASATANPSLQDRLFEKPIAGCIPSRARMESGRGVVVVDAFEAFLKLAVS